MTFQKSFKYVARSKRCQKEWRRSGQTFRCVLIPSRREVWRYLVYFFSFSTELHRRKQGNGMSPNESFQFPWSVSPLVLTGGVKINQFQDVPSDSWMFWIEILHPQRIFAHVWHWLMVRWHSLLAYWKIIACLPHWTRVAGMAELQI